MNTEKIGNFIKERRKEKNLTQKDIANELGITDRAVSKWERGLGCPDVSLLEDLSKILDVSIVEILNGEFIKEEMKEKHLINTINYSKETVKLKIKNSLNIILTFVIIFILSLLIIFNISNYYKLNKKYETDSILFDKNNYEKYYEIIVSNQGKYTDEEYKKITNYVKDSKQRLDELYDDYYDKNYIKMKDYYKFLEKYESKIDTYNVIRQNNNSLYSILLRYDNSDNMFNNMLQYEKRINSNLKTYDSIKLFINSLYKYNANNSDYSRLRGYIHFSYVIDEQLFKDIIKVGELYEK